MPLKLTAGPDSWPRLNITCTSARPLQIAPLEAIVVAAAAAPTRLLPRAGPASA